MSYKLNEHPVYCFNLAEKERFRQLISGNLVSLNNKFNRKGSLTNKKSTVNNTNNKNTTTNNIYEDIIHSSPTKVQDDNSVDSRKNFNQTSSDFLIDKYNVSNLFRVSNESFGKTVSIGYSRRISLSLDSKNQILTNKRLGNTNKFLNTTKNSFYKSTPKNHNFLNRTRQREKENEKKEKTIIELDLTENDSNSNSNSNSDSTNSNNTINNSNNNTIKSAQKRHTTQQNSHDENDHRSTNNSETSSFQPDSKNFNLSSYQNIAKVNRKLTEFEKRLNDRLNKNASILEIILKKSQTKSNALMLEEERYKLKKIQRIEKDKIEQELALKFSQQLHLEANKLSPILLEEERPEIEDEFPKLTDEQDVQIRNAFIASPPDEVLISGFGADITRRDIQTLKGLNWLNDEIINFYMSLICERSQSNNQMHKTYAFSTFFYPKLVKDGYNSLRRWTRKVDLFSHDLIIVPVHLGLHWTLSVIDFTCREIRYYDSMNGNNNECLNALRNYLKDEHADKKGFQFDLSNWNCIHVKDVPQQMNGSDCGMFTCKYAEALSRGKTVFNFDQSHMPYFRRRMVWEIINKKLM